MFKKNMQRTVLNSLIKEKSSQEYSWDEGNQMLLDFCVKIIPKIVSTERCSIFIHDPESDAAWLQAGTGLETGAIDVSLESDSIVGRVISTGEAVIVNDMASIEGLHKELEKDTGFVTRDILCIPILSLDGSRVTGAVQLLNRMYDHKFSAADQKLMEEIAVFIQHTLENIFYRSLTQKTVQRAFLVTRLTSIIGLAILLGITGAFTLWVMWIAISAIT